MGLLDMSAVYSKTYHAPHRYACRTLFYSAACLVSVLPAAHAHDDSEMASPTEIAWGLLFFVVTLACVLRWCLNPPNKRSRLGFVSARLPRRKLRPAHARERKKTMENRAKNKINKRCTLLWLCCLLWGGVLLPAPALCHPMAPDLTVAQLRVHYKLLEMTLTGPASEFLSQAGVRSRELDGEHTAPAVQERIAKWLPFAFALQAEGKPLPAEVLSAEYLPSSQRNNDSFRLEVRYPTDKPAEKMRVTSKFIHTIVACGGVQFEMRNDKETTRDFDTKANLGNIWNNVADFMQMGMEHLFTGPDHILFICTLIFALMEFRGVVKMLTGFTVGHSITLILSTYNVIHISPRLADMGIALTILYVGLENIISKKPPKHRFWLVTIFGLIHGMGFSASLKEVGLPEQGLVLCLLSFNLGIELAQIIIVACVYPLLAHIRWRKEGLEVERETGTRKFKQLMNLGSAATACMGLYWFVERLTGS